VLGRPIDRDDVEVHVHEVVEQHDGQGRDPEVLGDEDRHLASTSSRQLGHPRDHGIHGSGSRVKTKVHVGYLVRVPGGERSRHRHRDHIGLGERRPARSLRFDPMSR
jgi:hypothetical protein